MWNYYEIFSLCKSRFISLAHFETQLVRGKDVFKHNPSAQIPKGEATPNQKFQHSSEFENQWQFNS